MKISRRFLCCAVAAFWITPIFAAASPEFDQFLPQAAQMAAVIGKTSSITVRPARGVLVKSQPSSGRFELIGVVDPACANLSSYENRSKCYSSALAAIGDSHLLAISRTCNALNTWMDQANCLTRAVSRLTPDLYGDYSATKQVILAMCNEPNTWMDRSNCFRRAASVAGGHFESILQVCGNLSSYENRSRCFRQALE